MSLAALDDGRRALAAALDACDLAGIEAATRAVASATAAVRTDGTDDRAAVVHALDGVDAVRARLNVLIDAAGQSVGRATRSTATYGRDARIVRG